MLQGRMINVELTAGGGGKGEKRMEKLRERNKALLGQRVSLPSPKVSVLMLIDFAEKESGEGRRERRVLSLKTR